MAKTKQKKTVCDDCDGDGENPRSQLGSGGICRKCNGTGELPRGDEPDWVEVHIITDWM